MNRICTKLICFLSQLLRVEWLGSAKPDLFYSYRFPNCATNHPGAVLPVYFLSLKNPSHLNKVVPSLRFLTTISLLLYLVVSPKQTKLHYRFNSRALSINSLYRMMDVGPLPLCERQIAGNPVYLPFVGYDWRRAALIYETPAYHAKVGLTGGFLLASTIHNYMLYYGITVFGKELIPSQPHEEMLLQDVGNNFASESRLRLLRAVSHRSLVKPK
ncbi:hypothetical protein ABMA28_008166 [Loxostege sticticalis]|uniref:Uncharacterized protein n=1 Tax=Loxostege sticticalis TaxID=481309 RepID=A0ABD0SG77_LOXSC